jgi:MFS family permease
MTGAIGASFAVAAVAGPLIGGAFTSNTTWRWCFWINLPIGGVSAALIAIFFKAPPQARAKNVPYKEILLQMDPSGIVLLLGAILCFLLALQWGGSAKAWGSADVIGTLVGFGLLLIAFTINELWLQEKAMIPPRLLKGQTILFSCLFTFFFSGSFYLLLYYLPTYFQSVKGASASDSGVRTLPLVLGDGLFATLSGAALGMIGYYMPLLTLGGVLTTVASGLLYTLDLHSGSNEWIGYQAMAGIGVGLAIQVPMMASQAVVGVEDLSTVSAMILFFQCMGGAIFVQAGQAAFTNKLVQEVLRHLPNVSAARVTSTGATELQSEFHGHELQVILEAYVAGLQDAFIVAIVLAGIATLLSLGSGWRSVKSKKEEPKAQP